MRVRIQLFMAAELLLFACAALVHGGLLVAGYEHRQARIAETVLAAVLLGGLLVIWYRPVWARKAGIAAQAFALLGTLAGGFTIIVGVGPRTMPDIVYHAVLLLVLFCGVLVAIRAKPHDASA